jgi:hypothetical protein
MFNIPKMGQLPTPVVYNGRSENNMDDDWDDDWG